MSNNSTQKADANNMKGNNNGIKPYRITFGIFNENEKGELNLPPENSKEYNNLLNTLETHNEMPIEAKDYTKVLSESGKILARVAKDGKVITGKLPRTKSAREIQEQEKA